jgi:hypothetical protein
MGEEEREKLKILLGHWVEHNREHSEEFRKWAGKVADFGETIVHHNILEAVQQMDKANESLLRALEKLS